MKNTFRDDKNIKQLIDWACQKNDVRAMLLTSSRTYPSSNVDIFSDYDVILVVNEIQPYYSDRSWLADFGKVLAVYRDPFEIYYGFNKFAYITQYEDGLKFDFTVWPIELLKTISKDTTLPADLDIGYSVLLDKDHLTEGLKTPTYQAYIPTPPSQEDYLTEIEVFFHEATYVAKNLWRGDLIFAKYNLDYAMKTRHLLTMLEWQIEIDHHWSLKPGNLGKGLRKLVSPQLWAELESTYVGAAEEENWKALFKTIELFRKIAIQVGEHFDFPYPYDLEKRVLDYLIKVKNMPK
jgi:aminoglycoside 6-adenylyltransferase